jgi:hypothetical protein
MSDNNQNPIQSAPVVSASAGEADVAASRAPEQQAHPSNAGDAVGGTPSTAKTASGSRKSSSSEVRR